MAVRRTLVDLMLAEPFRPFRLHVTDGQTLDVLYPESFKLGRSFVYIYVSSENDPEGPERWHKVSLMLVESVEPLMPAGTTGSP
jgi:hypothetical protein